MSKYKLCEIGFFKNGLNFSADKVDSGCKIIGIPDFGDKYVANIDGLKEINSEIVTSDYYLKENDILLVRSNGNKNLVGRSMIIGEINEPVSFSGFCIRFRVTNNQVLPLYVLYLLKSPLFRKLFSNTQQTSISNLNQDILGNIEFDIPTLNEQHKIVEILHSITLKIETNEKINDNLLKQFNTIYNYWFTQFDFPCSNNSSYNHSGGAMIWSEQLKKNIPCGWQVLKVSQCINRIATGLNPRDNFILGHGYIKYITVKNLTTSGTLDFTGCDTINEEARTLIHKRSDIQVGDILFASIAPLGRCYLIQTAPDNWDINESVFSIRPNTELVTSEYLYAYFVSEAFIRMATSSSTGSIFKGIRINTLLDSLIIVPPFDILQKFTTVCAPLLKKRALVCSEIETLTNIRNWLLPMLMNGQATIAD